MRLLDPIHIPLGRGGLNSTKSISRFPITDLTEAENVTTEDEILRKIGGAVKINTTPISGSPRIMGGHHFINPSTNSIVAATGDGKIVTVVVGGIGATLKTGLGSNKFSVFAEAGGGTTKKLFHTNGFDVVQVWDGAGATTTNITTPPADWTGNNQPLGLCMHGGGAGASGGGRLVGWGNANDPHRIYLSQPGNHEVFTGAGSASVSVFPGEGEGIRCCYSYKGLLIIFKYPRGIYFLDDSSSTITEWFVKRLTAQIGCPSPRGVIQGDDELYFMGTDGLVYALSGITEFGNVRSAAVYPDRIQRHVAENVALSNLDRCAAEYIPGKRKAIFCVTKIGSSPVVNNAKLIVELPTLREPLFTWDTKDVCETIFTRTNSSGQREPIVGDNAGTLWAIEQDSRSLAGTPYTGRAATGEIPLIGNGQRRANIHFIELVYRPVGDWNLSVDVEIDGVYIKTLLFNMGGPPGGLLDTGELDTMILGGERLANRKLRVGRDGRRIRLIFYNSGDTQDFQLTDALIYVSPGNDRR